MSPRNARCGLSRCDVIIVIVAGLMFFTLCAPAIRDMRAASARADCALNMRQLALAAFNHESALKRFPLVSTSQGPLTKVAPAASGDAPSATAGYSCFANMLPFMEERILFDELRHKSEKLQKPPFDAGLLREDGKTHLATVKIPALVCPAMKKETVDTQFAASVDGKQASVKTEYDAWAKRFGTPALGSYVGITGTHYDPDKGLVENGVMVSRCSDKDGEGNCIGKGLKIGQIGDGTAKTLLFSESREVAYAAWIDGQAAWVVGLDGSGKIARGDDRFMTAERTLLNAGPDDEKMELSPTYSDLGLHESQAWPAQAPRRWGPSSRHPNGAINHAFCDGHVMALSAEIDPSLYARLITRDDGDPIGEVEEAPDGDLITQADVPMDLRATIDNGIALVKKKDYIAMFKLLAPPEELKRITARQSLAEMAKGFAARKQDKIMLKAFEATSDPKTKIREDDGAYIFDFGERIGPKESMRFEKIDGKWYITN